MIGLASIFRNSAHRLDHWTRQVVALRDALRPEPLHLILVHGDSQDDTEGRLHEIARQHHLSASIAEYSHGGLEYGSCEHPERLKNLTYVLNGVLQEVSIGPDHLDKLIYVESDLLWDTPTMQRLLARCDREHPIVSPMIMCHRTDTFYDIWAFRTIDGRQFGPFYKYYDDLYLDPDRLTEVGSTGSCLVMLGDVARCCDAIDNMCLVGLCRDARTKGYTVWVDPKARVDHPA